MKCQKSCFNCSQGKFIKSYPSTYYEQGEPDMVECDFWSEKRDNKWEKHRKKRMNEHQIVQNLIYKFRFLKYFFNFYAQNRLLFYEEFIAKHCRHYKPRKINTECALCKKQIKNKKEYKWKWWAYLWDNQIVCSKQCKQILENKFNEEQIEENIII